MLVKKKHFFLGDFTSTEFALAKLIKVNDFANAPLSFHLTLKIVIQPYSWNLVLDPLFQLLKWNANPWSNLIKFFFFILQKPDMNESQYFLLGDQSFYSYENSLIYWSKALQNVISQSLNLIVKAIHPLDKNFTVPILSYLINVCCVWVFLC